MILPIEKKYFDKVTQGFGESNEAYASGVHNGTDFACPIGTPVVAPCDGEMYFRTTDHPTLGGAVYFRFTLDGTMYWMRFLHLSQVCPLGQYKQGDLIGRSGNTGMSTGPHLHLDLWTRPVDASSIRTKQRVFANMLDPLRFIQERV